MTFNATDTATRYPTGFLRFDDAIGGLRTGLTYILGGEEKSGKSSILYTWVNTWLSESVPVSFINTEQSKADFLNRITSNWMKKDADDITKDDRQKWMDTFKLPYAGIEDIANTTGSPDFEKAFKFVQSFAEAGTKIIVFDNITTFGAAGAQYKKTYEVIAACLNRLIVYAKTKGVIIIPVIHTVKGLELHEAPGHVTKLLESGHGEEIFEKSITVIRRPTGGDLYGSSAGLSQCGATILLWRPYQKFPSAIAGEMERLIIDSSTHGKSADVGLKFIGAQYRHEEIETRSIPEIYQDLGNKNYD
jgi:hypothetical protein